MLLSIILPTDVHDTSADVGHRHHELNGDMVTQFEEIDLRFD